MKHFLCKNIIWRKLVSWSIRWFILTDMLSMGTTNRYFPFFLSLYLILLQIVMDEDRIIDVESTPPKYITLTVSDEVRLSLRIQICIIYP